MRRYTTPSRESITLDDLPGDRCRDAIALLAHLRRAGRMTVVWGAPTAWIAEDLEWCDLAVIDWALGMGNTLIGDVRPVEVSR